MHELTEEQFRDEAQNHWAIEGFLPGNGTIVPVGELPRPSALTEGIRVIDCDTHFTEPRDMWTSRAPARLRDRMPHVRRVGDLDKWFIGDLDCGTIGGSVIAGDRSKLLGKLGFSTFDQAHPSSYRVKERLEMMDELGIHAQLTYQNAGCTQVGTLMHLADPELALEIVRIFNDAASERQVESSDRIFGMALLPIWDRDAMEKEALRCIRDLGLKGFVLPDSPDRYGIPGFLSDHWTPLFTLCNDEQIPINFHFASSLDAFPLTWPDFSFQKRMAIASTLFYLGNAATMSNFLMSGLFDRYGKLRMVSVESGLGWVPFVVEALEYQADEMMPEERRRLGRRPTEYLKEHFWFCFWFEKHGVRQVIDLVGDGHILYETDFPHPTSLYPDLPGHLDRSFTGLPELTRRRILHDNAVALYHLPV
jgi:predicted TIM-barrel fold metal-dependent hydrolase